MKKREREFTSRIGALEEELRHERQLRAGLEAKTEFLSEKVKTVAERSKNRASMLVKLIGSIRRVQDAKHRLQEAEQDMESIMQSAMTMMEEEQRNFTQTQAGEAETRVKPEVSEPQSNREATAEVEKPAGAGAATAVPDARGNESAPGGWTEASFAGDGTNAGGPGKFKPVTFRFKL